MTEKAGGRGVRAAINYVRNRPAAAAPPLTFVSEAEEQSTMLTLPGREMWISDARGSGASLAVEGFELFAHESRVAGLDNVELDPAASETYTLELCALARTFSGATLVLPLGGAKQRFSETATDRLAPLKNAKPARYPHADNTDASSQAQIKFFVEDLHGRKLSDYRRAALYNLWRCLSAPPQDAPLAVCDARSIDPADEVTVTAITEVLGLGEMRHDTTSYTHNPAHRWHYFPDMTPGEVLVFKTHDTDPAHPKRVAHTAFDSPDCPPGTPPRASAEVRILALFD